MPIKVELTNVGDEFPWEALLGLAPHLLWIAAITAFLLWIGRQRLTALIDRLRKVTVAGLDFDFGDAIQSIGDEKKAPIDARVSDRLQRRLERSFAITSGARVLWVDDHPDNNRLEAEVLEQAGISIDRAPDTAEALKLYARRPYDVVISDRQRGTDTNAGFDLAKQLHAKPSPPPVIIYCGEVSPAPIEVFGLTVNPAELVHLVLDALSRVRG